MKLSKPFNGKKHKGQATIEFMLVMPFVVVLFVWIFNIAMTWHGYHVSTNLALVGSSWEQKEPGSYSGVLDIAGSYVPPSWELSASSEQYEAGSYVKNTQYTLVRIKGDGSFVFGMPFGLEQNVKYEASCIAPIWEWTP